MRQYLLNGREKIQGRTARDLLRAIRRAWWTKPTYAQMYEFASKQFGRPITTPGQYIQALLKAGQLKPMPEGFPAWPGEGK